MAIRKHEDLFFQFFLVHALPPQLRPENLPNQVYQVYLMLKLLLFLKVVSSSRNQEDILGDSLGARVVQLQTDSSSRTSSGLFVLNLEPSSFWLFSSRLWNTFRNFLRMMGGRELFSWIYSGFIVFLERSFWLWVLPLKSAPGWLSFLWRWKSLEDFSILPLSLGFGNCPTKCFRWGGHF